MNNITALVAIGPNDVHIPFMFFQTKDEAIAFVENELSLVTKNPDAKYVSYDRNAEGVPLWKLLNERDEEGDEGEFPRKVFGECGYYGGCGKCSDIEVREIEFGKAIVGFDLD